MPFGISSSVSTPVKPAAFACQRFVQVTNKDTIKENAGCDFCNEVKITFWYLAMAGYTVMFNFNSNCRTTPLEHITTFLSLCVIVGGPTTLHSLSSALSLIFSSVYLSVYAAVQQYACMFASSIRRSIMEVKERRPYCSLTKSRKDKEGPYSGETAHLEHS